MNHLRFTGAKGDKKKRTEMRFFVVLIAPAVLFQSFKGFKVSMLHVVGHVRILRDNSKNGKLDREVKMTKYGFIKSLWSMTQR